MLNHEHVLMRLRKIDAFLVRSSDAFVAGSMTTQMTRFRDAKVCATIWLQMKLTITEYSLT